MPRRNYFDFIDEVVTSIPLPDVTGRVPGASDLVRARVAEPPTLGQGVPPPIPYPTLGDPTEFRLAGTQYKNQASEFWKLSDRDQRRYTADAAFMSRESLAEKYGVTSPPWLPTGKISGIGENISAGLTSRAPIDVPASSPTLNMIGNFVGEGIKYGALASSGLGLGGAAIASGSARIAQADDNAQLLGGMAEVATGPLFGLSGKLSGVSKLADDVKIQQVSPDIQKPTTPTPATLAKQEQAPILSGKAIGEGPLVPKMKESVIEYKPDGSKIKSAERTRGVTGGKRFFRETDTDAAELFLPRPYGNATASPQELFFSDVPELALGQGSNRGVLLEFGDIAKAGRFRRIKKPGSDLVAGSEFHSLEPPSLFKQDLISITINPNAQFSSKGMAIRWRRILKKMEDGGWVRQKMPDGSIKMTRPDMAEKNPFQAPFVNPNKSISLSSFGYTPDGAAALQKAWETKIINPAAEAIKRNTPEKIKEYVNKVFGGRTSDPALAPVLAERERAVQTAQIQSKQIIADIEDNVVGSVATETGRSKDEIRAQVFKYLDPTVSPDNALGDIPTMYRPWLDRARNMIDDYSQQLVDLGVGPVESIQKNIGEYMSRYYKDKSLRDAWRDSMRNWFKSGMSQRQMRGRKLRSPEDYAKRQELGLIEDYQYAFSRTVGEQAYNVSAFRAYRQIGQNPEWATGEALEGWKLMPSDPKKYGDLAGKYIRPDVWDNVQEMRFFADRGTVGRVYDKLLASWKFGKTALSPATHGRNIISNAVLADFGGLSPIDIRAYAAAAKQYQFRGQLYREALEDGLLGSDWYGAEVGNYLGNIKRGESMFDVAFDRIRQSGVGRLTEKAGALYQGEEHFFKLALYMKKRSEGMAREAAAAHAQKHLFDYGDISPFLQRLRRSPFGGPFLAFTAKSVPVMVEAAAKHPWRVGKYYAMFEGLNAYSKATLGISEEEYREIMDDLPPWQRNGWTILLPERDENDKPVIWDLTYNLPWGDLTEQGSLLPNVGIKIPVVGPLVERFVGSNPAMRLPAELALNRNAYSGKEIVNTEGKSILSGRGVDERVEGFNVPGLSRAAEKRWHHIFRTLAPGAVLSAVDVGHAILDGKTKNGEDISVPITLLNKLVGIKVSSVDKELSTAIQEGEYTKLLRALRKEYIKVDLDESLSEQDRKEKLAKIEAAIEEAQFEFDRQEKRETPQRDTTNLPPIEDFDFMKR